MESTSRSGTARWTRPAVLLNACGTQTGEAVRLEGSLPGKVLLLRNLIAVEGLLHCDPAATHGSHHRCFMRATHRVVLGGGRSSIAEDRCTDGSMMLFSRFERRSWTRPIDRSLTAISVDEIGWLPPHDSGRGHSHLIAALMQKYRSLPQS